VVFDTVGGEVLARSWAVLKPGGRIVTIASAAEGKASDRAKQAFFIVEPNRKQLIEIGDRIEDGRLHTVVDSVLPLSRAAEFYTGHAKRQGRGKLVVEIAA
jgi:NADPH:quinone reductase-like Zn-dependent oxidoreductase